MASSPQPAETPVSVNPHQNARYTIKLSERITNPSAGQPRYSTVQLNHKPKANGNVRTTKIRPASTDDDKFSLCIRERESADSTKTSTYEYAGERRELKQTYVLLFDTENHTATLEPLDETYAFNLKRAPWEKDAAKLAEQYEQVKPRKEKLDSQSDLFDEDAADDLFSDGPGTPQSVNESIPAGSLSDEDLEPEPGNPFDWRNFIKDVQQREDRSASPQSQSDTPLRSATTASSAAAPTSASAPARSTPIPRSEQPKTNHAVKPTPRPAAKKQVTTAASRKRKSPEPEQPAAKLKEKDTTISSAKAATSKAQPTPSIRLDRRASTRPTDAALSTPASAAAPSQQSSKSSSRTSREPTPDDDDDDDDTYGGLEIDWGGSDKSASRGRPKRSIALAFEQGVTGDGPVSLRSAADSASPNSRLHTPSMRATNARHAAAAPDVIEFDVGGADEDDELEDDDDEEQDGGHHRQPAHEQEADEEEEEQEEQEDDDDGYAEDDEDADGDVDPLTLGSPAADTLQQHQQHQQQVDLGPGGDEEDDGGDDLEDDFEAEMAQALASAAEEDGAVAHEESEEESEEE